MKRKRFPAEQIVSIFRQAALGMAVGDIVRQLGISEQTFYRWKKLYGGMQAEGMRELKIRQDENARLEKLARACRLINRVRLRWGYRRLHVLLKREGFKTGVNQTYRWCRLEELQLRSWRKIRQFVDNGSEFSGQLLDLWACHHKAKIDFSRPGAWTTMRPVLTHLSKTKRQHISPAAQPLETARRQNNRPGPHR